MKVTGAKGGERVGRLAAGQIIEIRASETETGLKESEGLPDAIQQGVKFPSLPPHWEAFPRCARSFPAHAASGLSSPPAVPITSTTQRRFLHINSWEQVIHLDVRLQSTLRHSSSTSVETSRNNKALFFKKSSDVVVFDVFLEVPAKFSNYFLFPNQNNLHCKHLPLRR